MGNIKAKWRPHSLKTHNLPHSKIPQSYLVSTSIESNHFRTVQQRHEIKPPNQPDQKRKQIKTDVQDFIYMQPKQTRICTCKPKKSGSISGITSTASVDLWCDFWGKSPVFRHASIFWEDVDSCIGEVEIWGAFLFCVVMFSFFYSFLLYVRWNSLYVKGVDSLIPGYILFIFHYTFYLISPLDTILSLNITYITPRNTYHQRPNLRTSINKALRLRPQFSKMHQLDLAPYLREPRPYTIQPIPEDLITSPSSSSAQTTNPPTQHSTYFIFRVYAQVLYSMTPSRPFR